MRISGTVTRSVPLTALLGRATALAGTFDLPFTAAEVELLGPTFDELRASGILTGLHISDTDLYPLRGTQAPDDALVVAPVGSRYEQLGTSIVWVKYGANDYNWRPRSCDPMDGFIGPNYQGDGESSGATFVNSVGTTPAITSINTGLPGRLGIATMTVTSVTTPDRTRVFHLGGGNPTQGIVVGGGKIYMFVSVNIPVLSDGVDNFSARVLGGDGILSLDHANGVYLENDRNVHGDNNWRLRTADNSVRTTLDLGVTSLPVAGAWQKLGIVINAAGTSAQALIDDTRIGAPVTTNIPSGGRGFAVLEQLIKTLGVGPCSMLVDYTYVAIMCDAKR